MEEFGLMAAHDDRPGDPVGYVRRPVDVAVVAGVFRGHHQHLTAGGRHQLPEPHIADPDVEGRADQPVVVDEGLNGA